MGETRTLAERVYDLSDFTGHDTMVIMNTYIAQEGKMYIRNITAKDRVTATGKFENDALNIMERYARIHYERC